MRLTRLFPRRPARAWVFGLVIGVVAGIASIYLVAHPPEGGAAMATVAPSAP